MAQSHLSINYGQVLIELLIAIGISSILLPAILTGLISSREGSVQQSQRLTATALLKETYEAVRSVREKGWNEFAKNGTFHPEVSGNSWVLLQGSQTVNEFTRSVTISDSYRDVNGKISSVGTVDPSTKKVTIAVSWNAVLPSSITSTTYFTRFLGNTKFTETTESQFNAGARVNTVVTNLSGGEVQLGAGGKADWCKPNLAIPAVDLPKQGVANAISAIPGRVFTGTGDNASGVSFANVAISDTNPPAGTILGTIDGYKTNDVFGETNYVYLATDTNAKEIVIFNLSSTPYSEVGYFDSPGPTDAESVFVSRNIGYMTAGNKFYTFDLTSRSGSRPQLGSVALAGDGKDLQIVGDYAYVTIASSQTQLQIVNISNPASLSITGQAQVAGGEGKAIFVNSTGTRSYLVTKKSDSNKEFFIIDTSIKEGGRPTLGSYDTGQMDPKGITAVPGNKAIVVGTNGEEYQVIEITNESSPTRCGGLNIDTGVNGVASVTEPDGDAYSYIITGDASSELKIIEGGPGGGPTKEGTFESATFDAGASSAFNRFDTTFTQPSQTTIKFQVAVANAPSGSCSGATFSFFGPDGTSGSYFTAGAPIPFSANTGQCFRYKVYFSTDNPEATPVFYDITVNYSP